MSPSEFATVMEKLFKATGDGQTLTIDERIQFLAKVMQAAGLSPNIIDRVLAGEHHLFPAASDILKCENLDQAKKNMH